jgi:hypothetical protein
MAGPRKTRIEKFGGKIQTYVDLRLVDNHRRQCRLVDISRELKTKFGIDIPGATIWHYKNRRWGPQVLEVGALQFVVGVIRDVLGPDAISDSAQSRIVEALHEAFRHVAKLNPEFLLREQRLWADHNLRKQALAETARRLELRNRRLLREGARNGKRKADGDEKADPAEIRRRIREIYGLHDAPGGAGTPACAGADKSVGATAGPTRSGAAPAVPGEVARR